MNKVFINTVVYNRSLVDGPGIRTLVFLQGCDLHCPSCQNPWTWDIRNGKKMDIDSLIEELERKSINKKVTLTGGEPLYQKEALIILIKKLKEKGFDIALYTGHQKEEVPQEILENINYLKYGPFINEKKTTTTPYVGSTNQVFEKLR